MTSNPILIRGVTLRLPVLTLREAKRQAIIMALQIHRGNATEAARYLGLGQSTMYRLIADLNITDEDRYKD